MSWLKQLNQTQQQMLKTHTQIQTNSCCLPYLSVGITTTLYILLSLVTLLCTHQATDISKLIKPNYNKQALNTTFTS